MGVRLALFQHVKIWASEGQAWEEGNRKFVRKKKLLWLALEVRWDEPKTKKELNGGYSDKSKC